ncbi:hypothetical protein GJ496_001578 [Pomphorhynchus laevis]|nr:hypothetical protein GJ496_001578 [Pomphorhynchus laevis]
MTNEIDLSAIGNMIIGSGPVVSFDPLPREVTRNTANNTEDVGASVHSAKEESAAINAARSKQAAKLNKVTVSSLNSAHEAVCSRNSKSSIVKYRIGSVYTTNVVAYDPDSSDSYIVDWFSKLTHRIRGGPIAIRPGSAAANRGGVRVTVNIRALTSMAHGNVINHEQNIRRAANAITDELRFNIRYSNPIGFRESSTAYIKEFRCTKDYTDWRAVQYSLQTNYDVNREVATALSYHMISGLGYFDVTSWYSKLWILFFHTCWYLENNFAGAAVNVVNDVCQAASFRTVDRIPENVNRITNALMRGHLIVLERWSSAQDRLVYWLAANGLPRLTTPVVDPPMACLLDGVSVPSNPVLFLYDNKGVVPVQGDITPRDVLVAITACARERQESQFVIYGFIRASCIYNRYRGPTVAGAAQAYNSLLEWRTTDWPAPVFANSILINMKRYVIPTADWALTEINALLSGNIHTISDQSVWISLAVAISYSTALTVVNFRGDDMSMLSQARGQFEWRRFDVIFDEVTSRQPDRSRHMVASIASILRAQMGLPSLGYDAFVSAAWSGGQFRLTQMLTGDNAWIVSWPNSIPYPASPLSLLWLIRDYCAEWGIIRAPCSFRIIDELDYTGSYGEEFFIPSAGDTVIAEQDPSSEIPLCSPYISMLVNILMQGTRTLLPQPSAWIRYSRNTLLNVPLNADDPAIPGLTYNNNLFIIEPGSCPIFNWRYHIFVIPTWRRRDVPDSIWERLTCKGADQTPSVGLESVVRLNLTDRSDSIFSLAKIRPRKEARRQ